MLENPASVDITEGDPDAACNAMNGDLVMTDGILILEDTLERWTWGSRKLLVYRARCWSLSLYPKVQSQQICYGSCIAVDLAGSRAGDACTHPHAAIHNQGVLSGVTFRNQQYPETMARNVVLFYQWGRVHFMKEKPASDSRSFPSAKNWCNRACSPCEIRSRRRILIGDNIVVRGFFIYMVRGETRC